jgi:hypothetical protein
MTILPSGPPVGAVPGIGARPRLTIDLEAIAANTAALTRRASGELMAVVKADGFGHGAVDVARTALAHGATRLGVTSLDEAWSLRAAGLTVPVLSWLNPVDADYAAAIAHDIDVAVPSLAHLAAGREGVVQHRDRRPGLPQRVDGEGHVGAILRKLGLRDRVQIVVFAHEHGLAVT